MFYFSLLQYIFESQTRGFGTELCLTELYLLVHEPLLLLRSKTRTYFQRPETYGAIVTS